uniref:Integrase catalytic domain-containing protein n=1 Tax=Fagus sylvatica TaxID=28930 RepID=A0A2N9GX58_FAGSY
MDQRVEQLEQNMSSLMSSNQQLMEKMSEIYAKLSTIPINREEGEGSHSRSERRTEGRGHTDEAEQFFRFHETPIEDHVALASFHLEGEAQLWYQLLQQEAESLNWPTFKAGLLARYGPTQFFDHFGELTKPQQIGTVKDYHTKFEQLLAKAGPLPLTSGFIHCYRLARLYEARNSSFRRTTAPVLPINKMPPFSPREDTKPRSSFPLKRLTPTELKERREKGLCYNCNERFVPGHRCKKLFVIEACSEEEDNDSDMELEELEEIETPGISLHAMRGRDGPETMRVAGLIQAVSTTILLDSGSSHNFVSESLARKLQLHPVKGPRIRVMVASGEKLASKGKCVGVAVKLGKFQSQVDFFILPLEGYEAVLGTQWLRTLGEILWDFSKLTMKFQWNGRLVMLKGLTDQVIEGYELEKEVGVHPVGALVQLLAIESQNYTAAKRVAAPELQKILETFQDIFKEPMRITSQPYVLVFFDDIPVYNTNWEDHLKHLETTLAILKNHNLFVKLGKCEFGQMSVRYLGHIISHEGVCVDPEKISTMVEWPQPRSTRAMRGFLGLTGYYWKFIQDYGKIAAPLTQMLRKNSFNWSEKAVASFEKLKAWFYGKTDPLPSIAKLYMVGSLLFVLIKEVSNTFGRSLQYLWSQKIATEAQQKWLYKLMGFNFSIEYKRGSENKVADALSRQTEGLNEEQLMAFSSPVPHWVDAIREEQQVFFENIFKLHGMPRTIVCDRDVTFTSGFWTELFRLNGTSFNFSSAYHPQTNGQNEVVNHTLEMYLHYFTSDKPKQCWAEFCYKTSWHSAIKRTPFEVVYGREPPSLVTYVPGTAKVAAVEDELLQRDLVLANLKENIKPQLPITIGDHNELRVRPMAILDRRKRQNVEEVLVQWQGLPTSEATWENLTAMKSQFPEYALEDKGHRKGKGV